MMSTVNSKLRYVNSQDLTLFEKKMIFRQSLLGLPKYNIYNGKQKLIRRNGELFYGKEKVTSSSMFGILQSTGTSVDGSIPVASIASLSSGYVQQIKDMLGSQLMNVCSKELRLLTISQWTRFAMAVVSLFLKLLRMIMHGFSALLMIEILLDIGNLLLTSMEIFGVSYMANKFQDMIEMIGDQVEGSINNINSPPPSSSASVCSEDSTSVAGIPEYIFQSHTQNGAIFQTSGPPGKLQISLPSIETSIKLIIGVVSVIFTGFSFSGHSGFKKFQYNYVNNAKFISAMKDQTKDAKALVEDVSREVFNYDISDTAALVASLREEMLALESYSEKNQYEFMKDHSLYFGLRDRIIVAENVLAGVTRLGSKMANGVSSCTTLLTQSIVIAKKKRTEVATALNAQNPRIETSLFHIIGRRGAGKSWFCQQYLMPEVAKTLGWNPDVYNINFAGQEYWPPYSGQQFGFYDEFLAMKCDDPLIPSLNGIASVSHFNMPGADLLYKVQPCLMKAMFLISNQPYVSLLTKTTPEAENAFYTRLRRIVIINKKQPMTNDHSRDSIEHTSTYDEFEIRLYHKPANGATTIDWSSTKPGSECNSNGDDYQLLTKEELVQHVSGVIIEKMKSFHAAFPEQSSLNPDSVKVLNTIKEKTQEVCEANPLIIREVEEVVPINSNTLIQFTESVQTDSKQSYSTVNESKIRNNSFLYTSPLSTSEIYSAFNSHGFGCLNIKQLISIEDAKEVEMISNRVIKAYEHFDVKITKNIESPKGMYSLVGNAGKFHYSKSYIYWYDDEGVITFIIPRNFFISSAFIKLISSSFNKDILGNINGKVFVEDKFKQEFLSYTQNYDFIVYNTTSSEYQFGEIGVAQMWCDQYDEPSYIDLPSESESEEEIIRSSEDEGLDLMTREWNCTCGTSMKKIHWMLVSKIRNDVTILYDEKTYEQYMRDFDQYVINPSMLGIPSRCVCHHLLLNLYGRKLHRVCTPYIKRAVNRILYNERKFTDEEIRIGFAPLIDKITTRINGKWLILNDRVPLLQSKLENSNYIWTVVDGDVKRELDIFSKDGNISSVLTILESGYLNGIIVKENYRDPHFLRQLMMRIDCKHWKTIVRKLTVNDVKHFNEIGRLESEADGDNYVVHVMGPPGSGKSTMCRNLARDLSRIYKKPIIDITTKKLSNISVPLSPCIFVLHDKLTDERQYSQFYDSVPKPSIFLLSSNLSFEMVRKLEIVEGNMWSKFTYGLDSILSPSVQLKGYAQVNQEPGFGRRIGIPKKIYHQGQFSFTPVQNCLWLSMDRGRIIHNNLTKEIMQYTEVKTHVRTHYEFMKIAYGKIVVRESGNNHRGTMADVIVKASTNESLIKTVNSGVECIKAYWRTSQNLLNPGDTQISITQRVLDSGFVFTPEMFRLPDTCTREDLELLATRTYSVLRGADPTLTARIETDTFCAYCSAGVVEYSTTLVSTNFVDYSYEIIDTVNDPVFRLTIINYDEQLAPQVEERAIPLSNVISGLVNGFDEVNDFKDQQIVDYLLDKEQEILSYRSSRVIANKCKFQRVEAKLMANAESSFLLAWSTYVTSPAFKVLVSLVLILLTISGLCGMIKLIKYCFNSKEPDKIPPCNHTVKYVKGSYVEHNIKEGLPSSMLVDGIDNFQDQNVDVLVQLTYTIEGNLISVDASYCAEVNHSGLYDRLRRMLLARIDELYPSYILNNISFVYLESEYIHNQRHKDNRRGKAASKVVSKRMYNKDNSSISNITDEQERQLLLDNLNQVPGRFNWGNPQTNIIVDKIAKNMVIIRNEQTTGQLYGLALKENFIIAPCHIVSSNGIYKMKDLMNKEFMAQCIYKDPGNDVAIFTFNRKHHAQFPSIMSYFHKQKDTKNINDARWMRIQRNTLRPLWENINGGNIHFSEHPGFCNVRTIPYVLAQDGQTVTLNKSYFYESLSGVGFPSVQGDCGTPYMSASNSFGSNIILGFHVGSSISNTTSSCITQEYLADIFSEIEKNVHTAKLQSNSKEVNIVEDKPNNTDFYEVIVPGYADECSVPIYTDDFYAHVLDDLEEPHADDSLWRPAEGSNLQHIGRTYKFKPAFIGKHEHIPTPYTKLITLPNEKQLSIVNSYQLPKLERDKLCKINGKHSPIATQISYYNDPYKWDSLCDDLLEQSKKILLTRYAVLYKANHRILTTREVINGLFVNPRCEFFECLEAMDLDTSAGDFPIRKYNIMQKKSLFVEDDSLGTMRKMYKFATTPSAQDVQLRYNTYEEQALKGNRLLCVARDNLKREIVKGNKSRVFQSMSIEEVMVFRKYTGTLQAIMMKNHDRGHCQIGIDPVIEFHQLVNRFKLISAYGEAGDFSRWDKHIVPAVIKKAMDILYYIFIANYRGENKKTIRNVFDVLTSTLIYTVCECEGNFYMKFRGVPSGVAITSSINCVVNDLYMLMSIHWLANKHNQNCWDNGNWLSFFNTGDPLEKSVVPCDHICVDYDFVYKTFDWACYGDDKITVIKYLYQRIFNFVTFKKFYNQVLGISYDTPEKDGSEYRILPLSKLQFLSRTLHEENNITYPALKKSTINSFFHWTREMRQDIIEQLMRNALDEACLHDEEYYNEVVSNYMLVEAFCKRKLKWKAFDIPLLPYSVMREKFRTYIVNFDRHAPTFFFGEGSAFILNTERQFVINELD